MTLSLSDHTEFVLAIAPALGIPVTREHLEVNGENGPALIHELGAQHGARVHLFTAPAGKLSIDYRATLAGRGVPTSVTELERIEYLRPSRYVQSDTLTGFARSTFPGLKGADLIRAVGDWVHDRLRYDFMASPPGGDAITTLDAGAGVCRDFAHLTAALLRAMDVPARITSVYAPQLNPMDFHAVVEAALDDRWVVVDSTRLAPRTGLVRIATGRDAADTAFLTNTHADIDLVLLNVTASSDTFLIEDPDEFVEIG